MGGNIDSVLLLAYPPLQTKIIFHYIIRITYENLEKIY